MHGYHGDEGERKTQVQKLPVFLWEVEEERPGIQGQSGLHERLSHKKRIRISALFEMTLPMTYDF